MFVVVVIIVLSINNIPVSIKVFPVLLFLKLGIRQE